MTRNQRRGIAAAVAVALVVACVLWLWPGVLRDRGQDRAAQDLAAALGQGVLRGDPATLLQLAPEDGSPRTLLSPEAAAAIFGQDASVSVERTWSAAQAADFTLTFHTERGERQLGLELRQLEGPDGPWTPLPATFPTVTFSADPRTGSVPPRTPLRLHVNGTELTLSLRAPTDRLSFLPGELTFSDPGKGTPLRVVATPSSVNEGGQRVYLSQEPGDTYPAEARRALGDYLASCTRSPAPSTTACPFVPAPIGEGASQRRNLVFSAPRPTGYAAPDADDTGTLFAVVGVEVPVEGRVDATWEERVGNTWRSAKGSSNFTVTGSFQVSGEKIVFVPADDAGRAAIERAEADTDTGSAPRRLEAHS